MEFALICNSIISSFYSYFLVKEAELKACEREKNVERNEHTTAHQKKKKLFGNECVAFSRSGMR